MMQKTTSKTYASLLLLLFSSLLFAQTETQEICEEDIETYSVDEHAGSTYEWEITSGFTGTISGEDTHEIEIDWGNTPPGNYTLSVTETNAEGCEGDTVQLFISINEKPEAPDAEPIQPECGDTGGTITIENTSSSIEYSIDEETTLTGNNGTINFENVEPGTYNVIATNDDGCVSEPTSVTIDEVPEVPETPDVESFSPDCGEENGSIVIDNYDANNEYDYTIIVDGESVESNGNIFEDVPPGNYTVVAESEDGCTSESVVTIDEAPEVPETPDAEGFSPAYGEENGSIVINNYDANDEYDYTIIVDGESVESNVNIFEDVPPGDYTVVAESEDGCTSESDTTITIEEAPETPTTSPINFDE